MDAKIEKLKFSLRHNNPNLFVGAGFSLGATLQNNAPIPSGATLKNGIITNILKYPKSSPEYNELSILPLCKVCTITVAEKGREELYSYLQSIYQNVQPAEFHKSYIKYPWHNIYSTNIDDVIENACAIENVPIIIYNEPHNPKPKQDKSLVLYKLHGCVNNMDAGVIFDEEEYIDSILDRTDHRFGNLSIEFQTKDFVFVGSDFDDFNINYYLSLYSANGTDSGRGNLFFINPKPSYAFKSRIKQVGGILIEFNAKQFAELIDSIRFDLETINETKLSYDGYVRVKQLKDNLSSNHYDSDLYLGARPKWTDIFYDWDIILSPAIKTFISTLDDFEIDDKNTLVYAIHGRGYSGKSVLIKRLANILIDANYEIISFEGKNFNSNRFLHYINKSQYHKFALIVDDASYLYSQFEYLCKKVSGKIKLCIISASRIFLHNKRKYSLVNINSVEYEMTITIDEAIASDIINKLNQRGYLGRILRSCPDKDSQIQFAKNNTDIASAIFAITYGKDFQRRFAADVNNIIKDGNYRDPLIKLAIFQKMQLAYCPRELFVRLYGKRIIGILQRMENILRDAHSPRLELKNDFIGDIILKNSTSVEIINSLKELLVYISSMVENTSNSYWNEIQSILMRDKLVRDVLNIKPSDFKQMLYEIREYYYDNYNYWLQLGIAEQLAGDYDKALIHFSQAQIYGPKSYMVKNAIGRNYIFQAIKELDNDIAIKLFNEGKCILFELIKNREEYQAKAYSTHTYIAGLIRFYKRKHNLKISSKEAKEAQSLINTIRIKYKGDPIFENLNSTFTKFILQHSSNMTLNLQELQMSYRNCVDEVEFIDMD